MPRTKKEKTAVSAEEKKPEVKRPRAKKTVEKSAEKPAAKVKPEKPKAKSAAAKPPKKAAEKKYKSAKAKQPKSKINESFIDHLVDEMMGPQKKQAHPQPHTEAHKAEEKKQEPQPAAPETKPEAVPQEILPEEKPQPAAEKIKIQVSEQLTVKMLAEKMSVPVGELIKKFMSAGVLATINQRIDFDTASLIASEFNCEAQWVPMYGEEIQKASEEVDKSKLKPRAPVVTIMGHVDHGKTSLLDSIRKADVASKEAGGITQHIGAYKVKTPKGDIVFLDTPGHEAFSAMRARGAQVTDIVVLVVAADDGIKPQTVEAIDHAKAAGVPIIVAINKIDLPGANTQKVKQELSQYNLLAEDWGGKTVTVEVSARQGTNIESLLEMILLEAELLELKANPDTVASGVVIEARLDPKRGTVATLLVQNGTLRAIDTFVAGVCFGKVKALVDGHGVKLKEAGPSTPVEILGLSEAPQAGDKFFVVEDERKARDIAKNRQIVNREEKLIRRKHISLEDLNRKISENKIKELKVVVKADVQGSVEALKDSLEKLTNATIALRVIHSGVGGINESDVILAAASDAIIIGFNVRPDSGAEALALREGVEINTFRIIYEIVDSIKAALEGMLEPEYKEKIVGKASVKEVFKISKIGVVCGCYVKEGQAQRQVKGRLVREGIIVFEGPVIGLKRFKDDVRTVEKGYECGVTIENLQDAKKDDIIEFYAMEKVYKKLEL